MSDRCKRIISKKDVRLILGILRIADEDAYNHSLLVASLVDEILAELEKQNKLEWTNEECEEIITGAYLIDIGKAFLPFNLQHNSSKLNSYEKEIINMHPILGCEALIDKETNDVLFGQIVQDIVLKHHANANGTGYPYINGSVLNENNVPNYVWIVSYADRFCAMTRPRAFRNLLSYPAAWHELVIEISKGNLPYQYSGVFKQVIEKESLLPISEQEIERN